MLQRLLILLLLGHGLFFGMGKFSCTSLTEMEYCCTSALHVHELVQKLCGWIKLEVCTKKQIIIILDPGFSGEILLFFCWF